MCFIGHFLCYAWYHPKLEVRIWQRRKNRRVYAGYYNRYDGKLIYVVRVVTEIDTGEEIVICQYANYSDTGEYYTSELWQPTINSCSVLIKLWQSAVYAYLNFFASIFYISADTLIP